jgi:hypothetical protein
MTSTHRRDKQSESSWAPSHSALTVTWRREFLPQTTPSHTTVKSDNKIARKMKIFWNPTQRSYWSRNNCFMKVTLAWVKSWRSGAWSPNNANSSRCGKQIRVYLGCASITTCKRFSLLFREQKSCSTHPATTEFALTGNLNRKYPIPEW